MSDTHTDSDEHPFALTYGDTDLADVGYTDGSGVVLTPREVAALRGDPVRAMVTDDLAPVVVVYDDASRQLWPDEYAPDQPRPAIGDRILDEGWIEFALYDAFPPWSWEERGQAVGVDVQR